jgi:hypothetical protein
MIRFLTFEESVQGCPDLPFVRSINRGTSGGYPDKLYMKEKKRSAFGYDEVFTFDTPEAIQQRETFEEAMLALKTGPIEMVANIFPKDELRPKEKIKSLKTRLIAGFSCSATLVIRAIFGPFIDWFTCDENRIVNFSAVGVNPASHDWAKIAIDHGYGNPQFDTKAGDYSSMDKCIHPAIARQIFVIWMRFFGCRMTEEEQTIARNCWESIMNVIVVYGDNVIFWGNSNPSGNPLTTLINTIVNILLIMMAIILIYSCDEDYGGTDFFKDYIDVEKFWVSLRDAVKMTCYGDDNIFTIDTLHRVIRDRVPITYDNFSRAMKSLGFTYTDETKSSVFDETRRSIFDVGFLKRSFYKEGSNVLAPLDMNTIVQKIQWKKRKDPENELFFIKFETFIGELSVHSKETYEYYHKILFDALESSVPNHPISRSQTQAEWREHWSKVSEAL